MTGGFEDEFMDAQSQIISLCVEFAGKRADKVYAYGSIEKSSISFNAFFKIDDQIKTTNNIVPDTDAVWDFLDLGESDLEKISQICIHHGKPVPTELKMIYDCKSGKMDTAYKMEEIKRQCEKIIQMLHSDYNTQLQYSGIIKKIYDIMQQIKLRSCQRKNNAGENRLEEYFSFYPGVILNTKIIIFCGMRCFYIFSFGGSFS